MTKIEWADKTWNPVTGCTKISEGCKHCYAERMSHRLKGRFGYPEDEPFRVALHEDKLDTPLKWKKPRKVFVCSMGDLFHEDVPDTAIHQVLDICKQATQHTFLILTKRPERMKIELDDWYLFNHEHYPWDNIWLGVTIEHYKYSYRADYLRRCSAAVKFLSMEPLLSSMEDYPGVYDGMDWVICGGETGPGARTMGPDWARGVRDQCKEASVPFFFKKMGQGQPTPADLMIRDWPTQS